MSGKNAHNLLRSLVASQSDLKQLLRGSNLKVLLQNTVQLNDEEKKMLGDEFKGDTYNDILGGLVAKFSADGRDYNMDKKAFLMGTDENTTKLRQMLVNKLKESGVQLPDVADRLNTQAKDNIAKNGKTNYEKDVNIDQDDEQGDVVVGDKAPHGSATATLRPQFALAGSDNLRSTPVENIQGNAVFDAFSWVPDGYGLGPNNRLHLRNKQNDFLRFGMEDLAQPRSYEYTNMPHNVPQQWYNYRTPQQLAQDFNQEYMRESLEMETSARQLSRPLNVLEHDYNTVSSSRGLPRRYPSLYVPVADNIRQFLPTQDYASSAFNRSNPMRDNVSDAWNFYQYGNYSNRL
jgi:hypothetical protein